MSLSERKFWRLAVVVVGTLLGVSLAVWGISAGVVAGQIAAAKGEMASIASQYSEVEKISDEVASCIAASEKLDTAYDTYWAAAMAWGDNMTTMSDYGIFAGDLLGIVATPQLAAEGDGYVNEAAQSGCAK